MQTVRQPLRLKPSPKAGFPETIRKFMPWRRGCPSAPRSVGAELERLALASPHLLSDLGFAEDPRAGTAHVSVWRNGAFEVAITRDPAPVTARAGIRVTP